MLHDINPQDITDTFNSSTGFDKIVTTERLLSVLGPAVMDLNSDVSSLLVP